MGLYDAIMEKKDGLPKEFLDCIQRAAIPIDDFDSFLCGALKRTFPTAFYLSLQSFFLTYSTSVQMSDGTMKEALRMSDKLLEEVFSFGSKYFKEEGISRISVEKGDSLEEELCRNIGDKGGMYVAHVWLHGLRDEKNGKIYHSYVEGE